MAGQNLGEKTLTPGFQCLRQKRMIGVGKSFSDQGPSLVPRHLFNVHQNTKKFQNRHCWVSIIELNHHFVGELIPSIVIPAITGDHVLQRAGYKKVLLNQAEFLSILSLIIWIKNFGNGFHHRFFTDRFHIASLIKHIQIKLFRGLGLP